VRAHGTQVYLIGAGPGAADLITLRAARVLGLADVVLIDDLVDRAVLANCASTTRIVSVGKRAGCRSTPQDFIQRLMLRHARQGHIVARLKGGDPLVFGRGGEELAFLERHGIRVEVVCGLTAGLAVPAAIGIPVTHRDCAHGVTFVTGHTRAGDEPDWSALARLRTTLVIYMGLSRIESIAAQLTAHGMRADTPSAVIEQGTTSAQRHIVAPLAALAGAAREAQIKAPALIVIGDVVAFARASELYSAPGCAAAAT
jgi:uroporphyrin-III C-methyltransferase